MLRWGIIILSKDIFRLIPNRGTDPKGDLGTKGRDYTELFGAFAELEEREGRSAFCTLEKKYQKCQNYQAQKLMAQMFVWALLIQCKHSRLL